jgi:L-aminopeptidase/D-esterase-like protein
MITAVPGIRIGHWTDRRALTGCTVIMPPEGTTGSVAIPGNAPATRETDVIAPGRRVDHPNAILLTGGSAFGLAAADGVMRYLEERGIGHETPIARIPIVPTAAIFDLGLGDPARRPGPEEGYAACESARSDDDSEGNVGAGTGATVGKLAGFDLVSKGGLGSAAVVAGDLVVGAVAVVNSIGDVIEEDGTVIAGARGEPILDPVAGTSTTICCVATNATLDKQACFEVATIAAAGLRHAIRPVHTMFDGDTVFALATGEVDAAAGVVGAMAADVLADAVRRAVRAAASVPGAPALGHRG